MLSNRALSSMLARSGDKQRCYEPGTTFRRVHPHNIVEMAEILSVSNDDVGIPHVRYSVRYQHPSRGDFDVALRMLALKSFADRYRD